MGGREPSVQGVRQIFGKGARITSTGPSPKRSDGHLSGHHQKSVAHPSVQGSVFVCRTTPESPTELTTLTLGRMVAQHKNPSSAPQTLRGHKMRLIERTPGALRRPEFLELR